MTQDVVSPLRSDPKALDAQVGAKVRGRMAEKGVTQEVVAHVLGIEQQSVSKRLRGNVPFKVHELFLVADLLGLSVSAMLDEMTQRPSPDGTRARRESNPRPSAYNIAVLTPSPAPMPVLVDADLAAA